MAVGCRLHCTGVLYDTVVSGGKSRVKVTFSSASLANTFLDRFDGTADKWVAKIPLAATFCQGIIRGADMEAQPEEFVQNGSTDTGAAVSLPRRGDCKDMLHLENGLTRTPEDSPSRERSFQQVFLYGNAFSAQPYVMPFNNAKRASDMDTLPPYAKVDLDVDDADMGTIPLRHATPHPDASTAVGSTVPTTGVHVPSRA